MSSQAYVEKGREESPPGIETKMELRSMRLLDFTSDDLRNHVADNFLLHEEARYFEKMESYFNYLSLSDDTKHDPIVSLYAVRNNSYNYLHVPEELKSSDFIAACLFNNRKSFLFMSDEDKCKKGVLAYISVADDELFKHFPDYLKNSEKFWSSVISINPNFVNKLSDGMLDKIAKFRSNESGSVLHKAEENEKPRAQTQEQQLAYELKKRGN